METTRRRALIATLGIAALPGCGSLDLGAVPEEGTPEPTTNGPTRTTLNDPTPTSSLEPSGPPEEEVPDRVADVYVYERDDGFSVVQGGEVIASHSDDLGRVINDAQAALSSGTILVAAAGASRTAIVHENDVTIGGIGGRTVLTPDEEAEGSFDLYHTTGGPVGARFESLQLDMGGRGRTGIRAEGYADVVFDGVWVRETADHGLALAGGQEATVRDCRFSGIGGDAIRLENAAGVMIRDCTSAGAKYGVHVRGSSEVVVRGFRSQGTRLNGVAIYDYTENWQVIGCRAVDDGHTPFAASPARNGSFVGCVAEGTTADGEGGFEIEYKAGHDSGDREAPVEGCAVVSCTAIDCNMGFYAREDDSEAVTDTPVIRPTFTRCTAIGCETGLFIDDNVVEALVDDFTAVECSTDIVDDGTRTVIDGRSENAGDPAVEGQWNGHGRTAAELGVTVEDTVNDAGYMATETGTWEQVA